MTRRTRRSLLAATGSALTAVLAGCRGLNPLSDEPPVEYDESALTSLPGGLPPVPSAAPVQPTTAHLGAARDRVRSLLSDADLARIPNEAVRAKLAREADSARTALARDEREQRSRVDAVAGLTHPRSEAMFVHAGLAAFDGDLTAADVDARRDRHHREAAAFLSDYRYVGPPDDPVGALAEHAQVVEWGHNGVRLTDSDQLQEYQNRVLHVAELAQGDEWGRAYAVDARRLSDHYVSTLADPYDYGTRFSRVAATLVADVEAHTAPPDREALTNGFERDIEDTAGETLLRELARNRWFGARNAVENRDAGRPALAVVASMRALAADRAFTAARDAVSGGAYGVPESVGPIEAERAAAVAGLRALLDTSPAPLARLLAATVANPVRTADRDIREGPISDPEDYLYAHYAIANHVGDAAPAVVRRVAGALDA